MNLTLLETLIVQFIGNLRVRYAVGKLVSCIKMISRFVGEYVPHNSSDCIAVTDGGIVNVLIEGTIDSEAKLKLSNVLGSVIEVNARHQSSEVL
jgi:hypothetical protein